MMRRRLDGAEELLDAPSHDPTELAESLDQVAEVNRRLGGRRAVWRAVRTLLRRDCETTVLDIGTGSADIPIALAERAARIGCPVRILATDVHPQVRSIALQRTTLSPAIRIGAADARALPFRDDAFDLVLLSMTLHHFEAADQRIVLREAARVARRALIVNELERSALNYAGARLMAATRWRGNRITRHDGPLSVLRAFTPGELEQAAADAGLEVCSIRRRWFYRLVMVAARAPCAPPS